MQGKDTILVHDGPHGGNVVQAVPGQVVTPCFEGAQAAGVCLDGVVADPLENACFGAETKGSARKSSPVRLLKPNRPAAKQSGNAPVTLHIYNVGRTRLGRFLNGLLKPLGTGIFHCGVEVYGYEWSYSNTRSGTGDGVFCCMPTLCEGHDYSEPLSMGVTTMSRSSIMDLISLLKREWQVHEYHTLRRNCCHFSNEFCQRLGVGSIPAWVMNLAGAGASVLDAKDVACYSITRTMCCELHGAESESKEEDSVVLAQMPVLSMQHDIVGPGQTAVAAS